jgi:hypothetical protein
LTVAANYPQSDWLNDYYVELQEVHTSQGLDHNGNASDPSRFVGISVECNKGVDALNTLCMGTFDSDLSKAAWSEEMSRDDVLYHSVCVQQDTLPFEVSMAVMQKRHGEVLDMARKGLKPFMEQSQKHLANHLSTLTV